MATATKPVWEGAKALRRFLVPIDTLEPFPGNPRRGDVESLRGSLRRFGQVLPVLADPALAGDGRRRIVARHHLVLAAAAEGWTHVALIEHEFVSEEEARAYLVADNRMSELGSFDVELLYAQLAALQAAEPGLLATGYTERDAAEVEAELAALRALQNPTPPSAFPPIDPLTMEVEHCCPACGYEWSGNPAPNGAESDEAPA